MFWDFFWFALWGLYIVAYFYVIFFVITDLFRDDSVNGWGKAAWIVFLVVFPFLAGIVYVIARGKGISERSHARYYRAPEQDDYRPAASSSPAEDIERAKALLDSGAISQGEFEAIKSKALGNQYFGA